MTWLFLPVTFADTVEVDPSQIPILIGSVDVLPPCLTRGQARNIWSYRTKNWPDMKKIKLVSYQTGTESFSEFVEASLNFRPYQLARTWEKMHSLGNSAAPVIVNTVEQMVELVEQTSGAIGYITIADLPVVKRHKVRVISIKTDQEGEQCTNSWKTIQEYGDIPLYLIETADGC
jgi:ABC-type phosphate transport system substrate-binding protein